MKLLPILLYSADKHSFPTSSWYPLGETNQPMFTRKFLIAKWNKALRARVLYRALNREDRGYLWLSIRFIEEVKSTAVGRIIVKILAKLNDALKNPFTRTMETFGIGQAHRLSNIAVQWGYNAATTWATHTAYIHHLTNNQLNTPGI